MRIQWGPVDGSGWVGRFMEDDDGHEQASEEPGDAGGATPGRSGTARDLNAGRKRP
jgi:hypothetical protein